MNAVFCKAEQGSREWLIERIPFITASDMHKVMAKGQGKTRKAYMVKKACEILSNEPVMGYKSSFMENGNAKEAQAARAYELIKGVELSKKPFAYLPKEKIGASIDRDIDGTDGIVEIKNVIATEQVELIETKKPKSEYVKQMQTQMLVFDKQWCDYVSQSLGDDIYGTLPKDKQIVIIRVHRDEKMIKDIKDESKKFHHDLDQLIKKLEK